jgi:hypothetical protein
MEKEDRLDPARPQRMADVRITSAVIRRSARKRLLEDWLQHEPGTYAARLDKDAAHGVLAGEWPWHPACRLRADPWRSVRDWAGEIPVSTAATVCDYLWEHNGYDRSLDATLPLALPGPWVVEHLGLHFGGGWPLDFRDAGGTVRFFDPAIDNDGPSAGLVDREALEAALARTDTTVVWLIEVEKSVHRQHFRPELRASRVVASCCWLDGRELRCETRTAAEHPTE